MKENYQIILNKTIDEIQKNNTVPSLLLHSCCAPCSSYVLEYLSEYFDITIFYYNPNISPEEEFYKRVSAQKDGFDYFTTTISISPHKNAQVLNQIGLELEESYSVKYLCSDFKKKNGYKRSCELSEIYGLYRQNYCGCVYSKLEADEREKAKNNNEQPLSVQ